METFLLLLILGAVTVAAFWLRRQIGDEWPPAPRPESSELRAPVAAPIADAAQPAVAPTPPVSTAVTGAVADVPQAPTAPLASPVTPEAPAPAVLPTAPDLPAATPVPVMPITGHVLQRVNWALVGGGLLLLVSAQLTGRVMLPGTRLPAFLLVIFGGLALLVGIRAFMRGELPGRIERLLTRLSIFLRVTPAQVVLLVLAPCFAWLTRLAAGDGLLANQATLANLTWVIAIGLVVAGSVNRREGDESERLGITRLDILLTLVIFILALALRATALTRFPNTYSGDEGSAGLFAVELLTGKVNNLFGLGWFSFPALYFAVQSAAIAALGQTVEAVRLTSAIAGALTVVAVYWLGRAMFDRTTALLAALYLIASHYHIHMSRIALNNVWDGLFATVAIFGLWYGWKSGRRWAFIVCGLALGLGHYFYVSIRPLPIMFLLWAAVAFWRQRAQFRERFHGLVLAAFIAAVVYLPLGIFFISNPDEFQAPLNRVTIFGDWLEQELALGERTTAGILLDQAIKGAMGFTHEPLRQWYNPGVPLLLSGTALLFLLGVLWSLINLDLRYFLLLLPLLTVIISNTFSQDVPSSQRYVLAMPFVALFVALPVGQAIAWLRTQYPRARQAIVAGGVALILLLSIIDVNYYFNRVYDDYVLGGLNTVVATEIAGYLREQEPPDQDVYFFGFPRMGYFSLSTIPFLAPEKHGIDVLDPLTAPPDYPLRGPTLFIFLPERLGELDFVRQRYPDGTYEEFFSDKGEFLFAVYKT